MNIIFFKITVTAKRQLTSEMRAKYPELYKLLDKTRLFLSCRKDSKMSNADFQEYVSMHSKKVYNKI